MTLTRAERWEEMGRLTSGGVQAREASRRAGRDGLCLPQAPAHVLWPVSLPSLFSPFAVLFCTKQAGLSGPSLWQKPFLPVSNRAKELLVSLCRLNISHHPQETIPARVHGLRGQGC